MIVNIKLCVEVELMCQQPSLFETCLLRLNSLLHSCKHKSRVLEMSCFAVQQALLRQHSTHHLRLHFQCYLM